MPMDLIHQLELNQHPEGGHYRRIFTSPVTVSTPQGPRPTMTAIYYLLAAGEFSAWHRLRSSELWHWQAGGDLRLYMILPNGVLLTEVLGPDAILTRAIPPETWFAAECGPGSDYALCTCTVTPGFDFADFEMAREAELVNLFPQHEALIRRLSREQQG